MASSEIEWTHATWNPIAGCAMVSPGCTNCYAMWFAARLQAMGKPKYHRTTVSSHGRIKWSGHINIDEGVLYAPLHWSRSQRIFVNSMSDLFFEKVPASVVRAVWEVMEHANWHEFQVLTKRPERMSAIINTQHLPTLPNVWLGTSVESASYIRRITALRQIPASVRFVSFEPLLGPVGTVDLSDIHWAIVGGESGPRARPMAQEWVEEIHRACQAQRVAFFFKQWGGTRKKKTGRMFHGRTWDEFPRGLGHSTGAGPWPNCE